LKVNARFLTGRNNAYLGYWVRNEKYGCMGSFFYGRLISILERF